MTHPNIQDTYYNDFADPRVLSIPKDLAGERLDVILAELLPDFSRNRLATWIKAGRVSVNGTPSRPKDRFDGGEVVCVWIEPDMLTLSCQAEAIDLNVIYEDGSILIIDKPPGLVVHPGNGHWSGTLLNGLLHHYPELHAVPRAGIVHRLDKDTSGLMVVARNLVAQNNLVKQLQARTVRRIYVAIVQGILTGEGVVDAPIGRHPRERTKMAVVDQGKTAVTHWKVLQSFAQHTLLQCRLETGRTHQIRVHMAYIKHPLAADPVYGEKKQASISSNICQVLMQFQRQALHAQTLALTHPKTNQLMHWDAPIPEDLSLLIKTLQGC